jgi:PAS domain S-box-containing protein
MDGIEAAGLIRERHDIPVVYLTSHADQETLRRAARTAPYGFVIKPGNDGWLQSAIEVALYKHATEIDLKRSEERFRATFEQAAVGIALMAPDGRWLRVNQRLCDLAGYDGQDLLSMTFRDITLAEDQTREQALMDQALSGTVSSYSLEKRFVRRNGELIWAFVSVSVVRRRSGQPDCLVVAAQDIDDRKRSGCPARERGAFPQPVRRGGGHRCPGL